MPFPFWLTQVRRLDSSPFKTNISTRETKAPVQKEKKKEKRRERKRRTRTNQV